MADSPINPQVGNGSPASQPNLTIDQGAARLGRFRHPCGPPRRARRPRRRHRAPVRPGFRARATAPRPAAVRRPRARGPGIRGFRARGAAPDRGRHRAVAGSGRDAGHAGGSAAVAGSGPRIITAKSAWCPRSRRQLEGGYHELNADREAVSAVHPAQPARPVARAREQMSGEQVYRLQQESAAAARVRAEPAGRGRPRTSSASRQHEVETARAMAPEIIGGWADPQVMEREIQATRAFLDKRGVPAATQAKLARDPWLASLAVDAAKFARCASAGSAGARASNGRCQPSSAGAGPGAGPRRRPARQAQASRAGRRDHAAAARRRRRPSPRGADPALIRPAAPRNRVRDRWPTFL